MPKSTAAQNSASKPRARRAAAPKPEPLKPEQVASLLAGLPGWRARRGNRALVRRFGFPGRRAAAAFAQFVVELVETGGYNAWIELRANVAIVTLFSPRARGVTLADVQLASTLVELRAP